MPQLAPAASLDFDANPTQHFRLPTTIPAAHPATPVTAATVDQARFLIAANRAGVQAPARTLTFSARQQPSRLR